MDLEQVGYDDHLRTIADHIVTANKKHGWVPRPVKVQVTAADTAHITISVKGVDTNGAVIDHSIAGVEYVGIQPRVGDSIWALDMGQGRWIGLGPVGMPKQMARGRIASVYGLSAAMPTGVGTGETTILGPLSFTAITDNRCIELHGIAPTVLNTTASIITARVFLKLSSDYYGQILNNTLAANARCHCNGSVLIENLPAGNYSAYMTVVSSAANSISIGANTALPVVGNATDQTGVARLWVVDHGQ